VDDAVACKLAEHNPDWDRVADSHGLVGAPVPAPVRGDEVHPAVAVEVPGGDAVPPATETRQSERGGAFLEFTALIAEDANRPPFAGQHQVGIAILVQVGEDRAADQTEPRETLGDAEALALVGEQTRRGRRGVAPGDRAATQEEIEVAVAVEIGKR